jgi:hypothetical protein
MLRAKQDPHFRQELIVEATNAFLDGDIDTGKGLLREKRDVRRIPIFNAQQNRIVKP